MDHFNDLSIVIQKCRNNQTRACNSKCHRRRLCEVRTQIEAIYSVLLFLFTSVIHNTEGYTMRNQCDRCNRPIKIVGRCDSAINIMVSFSLSLFSFVYPGVVKSIDKFDI